jgi:two-component system, cell cycle sensor histidine kinase and response regulator CckA
MSAFPRWWKAMLAFVMLLLLAGAFWYYRMQKQRVVEEANSNLNAIVRLQIDWINEWLSSRLKEATTTMSSRYYGPLAARWMESPPSAQEVDAVLSGFRLSKREYLFHDVLFVNATGKIYFRLIGASQTLHEMPRKAMEKAFRTRKPVASDLYMPLEDAHPQIDIVAPFFNDHKGASTPSGAIIFQYNVRESLYRIMRWPVHTNSAESLLVRREGESVLFLTELSYKKGSALTFRLPLSSKDAPAVKAVLGEYGVMRGIDYRGVPVLAVTARVLDTGWSMIAKIDEGEVLASFRRMFFLLSTMLLFLVASAFTAVAVLWQRNEKAHYRALFQAEAARRKNEELYRNALDSILEGCEIIDFTWRHIFINTSATRHSNRRKEDLLDNPLMEVFPGIEHTDAYAAFERCMNERTSQHIETLLDHPDKSRSWYEISVQPIPEGIFVLTSDITDRKRTEAENERLAAAIAQCGEVVIVLDTDKIIQYANPAFETITGFKREEVIGRPLPVNESQDEAFYREFWKALESGKTWKGRLINRKKDGVLYTEEAIISPVFGASGSIVSYVSVTRDISEYLKLQNEKEKLQEQFLQAQKMESIGRLAGGIAHDFNNMLNVISGHAQLALDVISPDHPLFQHFQEISKAALHSTDLTRQLLAFARKQTIAPKTLDLNSAVAELLSIIQRMIGEDIDLTWNPGLELWPVNIDPAQLNQVLTNLAVNARDAIDKNGKIVIETRNMVLDENYCATHQDYVAGEYVMLTLSDNGCGMDKEVIDHIFEPFFSTKKIGKGTGLGLATVYGIVKQNNGFINIYSEPNHGATINIYFPRHNSPAIARDMGTKPEPSRGGVDTILLVEDEPTVLSLTQRLLEHLGYTVMTAARPTEAMRLAENYAGEIHLLLADVIMPEMTGRELSEKLTILRPQIKTLFMSGYTADIIAHRGILEQGIHFIQKPFSGRALAAKVREAFET